jgi:UDP-N-acetylmuramyl pentapeptide phosphotransferase/UDP-N-acetylglucosamine-1-phosphate transferase
MSLPQSIAVVAATAGLAALLIVLLGPLLVRYALARPTPRGLHETPTPQGGGVAIMIAVVAVCACAAAIVGLPAGEAGALATALAAATGLAILGAIDDIRPLPAAPRFLAQFALVGLVVAMLPTERLFPGILPAPAQIAVTLLAGVWFVNLVNFMDGMDWMTVVEMAPLALFLTVCAFLGAVPAHVGLIAAALLGGALGFAPFNAPVARLFLGDVGSLSIGLLAGYGLAMLALSGHLAAAIIAPMYYLADSGWTLLARLARGEKLWLPHRQHFYQRARLAGMPVGQVLGRVGALNGALVALALLAVRLDAPRWSAAALALALAATMATLRRLARG